MVAEVMALALAVVVALMAVVRILMIFYVKNSCIEMALKFFQGGSDGEGVVAMVAVTAATTPTANITTTNITTAASTTTATTKKKLK